MFVSTELVSIFIFVVISQSILSLAVAHNSIYIVFTSIIWVLFPDKFMVGFVLSIIKFIQALKPVHPVKLHDFHVKI